MLPPSKGERPGLPLGDPAEEPGQMWSHAADDKQPDEKKAADEGDTERLSLHTELKDSLMWPRRELSGPKKQGRGGG